MNVKFSINSTRSHISCKEAALNASQSITVSVLQPGYLPWLGFFDQLYRSDHFVYYDDVQFDKHGWRNRNRIKSPNGPHWLSVPVLHKNQGKPRIMDVEIDNRQEWARKHLGTIKQFYNKAPFLNRYLPELEEILLRPWQKIAELDFAVADLIIRWLHLDCSIYRSSRLGIQGDRSSRLINICRHFGATHYLSGDAAEDYLDTPLFEEAGIKVVWQRYRHPVYPQLHGEFIPYLSILDLLLNCGDESKAILTGEAGKETT